MGSGSTKGVSVEGSSCDAPEACGSADSIPRDARASVLWRRNGRRVLRDSAITSLSPEGTKNSGSLRWRRKEPDQWAELTSAGNLSVLRLRGRAVRDRGWGAPR